MQSENETPPSREAFLFYGRQLSDMLVASVSRPGVRQSPVSLQAMSNAGLIGLWITRLLALGLIFQALISGFWSIVFIPIGIGFVGLLASSGVFYAGLALLGRFKKAALAGGTLLLAGGALAFFGYGFYVLASCGGIVNCGRNEPAYEVLVPVLLFAALDFLSSLVLFARSRAT